MLFPTPPDPILLQFAGLTIRWYGLLLAVAALGGYGLILRLADTNRLSRGHVDRLFFFVLVAGFVGARLYHVLNELPFYLDHPLNSIKIWQGGLALHGGLIGGGLTVLWYARRYKLNFLWLADMLAPALVLGQAIGRWGNYFNQELFGRPTNLPWGIPIDPNLVPHEFAGATSFHPTFLYESLWNLSILLIFVVIHQRRRQTDSIIHGTIFFLYLILYSIGRIGTELLRIDTTPVLVGIRLPILVSSLLIVVSCACLFLLKRQSNRLNPPMTH